jgi:ribose transport system substrate-binding protein
MASSTRRNFLKQAGFAAGTVLGVGSLMQLLGASAVAQPITVAAPVSFGQVGNEGLAAAQALIAASTAPVTNWDGPTDGPTAQGTKFIVYPSQDQRNGGALGVGDGVKEACEALGWQFRLIDGQGTTNGQTAAIQQAIALKPDGIVLGTIDAASQKTAIAAAVAQGIKVIGWHSAGTPGPWPDLNLITNIESDPVQTGAVSGAYTVAMANGQAGVVVFTDSAYAIAIVKHDAMMAAVNGVEGSSILELVDTPIAEVQTRMPGITTGLYQQYGAQLNWMIAVNDLYFDFAIPTLRTLGVPPSGPPQMVSGGDGSVSAYDRVRQGQYQSATIPEPLNLHGWQAIDEMNRAFAGAPPSGYVTPVHLVTMDNIGVDGGPNNIFDPDNGYRDQYKKIWGIG